MGCSNPHPHGQAWALSHVPTEPAQEISSFRAYQKKHNACILCTYVEAELVNSKTESTNRIIVQNESFMVVVPFWATWPFETMIVAKSHVSSISEMSDAMTRDLASAIRELTIRYDNLFECSFPYSMGLHQAPTATHEDGVCCHLHLHFYPPLLRSKEVRKFLVGFEMMAEPQRDLTAEQAASSAAEDANTTPFNERALELEETGPDTYMSVDLWQPSGNRGVFGGQVIGQALSAAGKTIN
ncbi:galactose-1-phosphate uridyl transferase, partial [Coemansia sp. RSA 1938]